MLDSLAGCGIVRTDRDQSPSLAKRPRGIPGRSKSEAGNRLVAVICHPGKWPFGEAKSDDRGKERVRW